MEILEWLGYPMVKNFEDIFIRFGATHERDRHTHRQTPHSGIYRAYAYASRGKNAIFDQYLALSRVDNSATVRCYQHGTAGAWQVGDSSLVYSSKRRSLLMA